MSFLVNLLHFLKVDIILDKVRELLFLVKLKRLSIKSGQKINFVPQGGYSLSILGDVSKFSIHETSCLKSDTVIECSGSVEIGKYLHVGKGLTIFSSNHKYDNSETIPYDKKSINKKVIIKDFVWLGANVTIVPGVTIGQGAVVGAGSVVTKDVPEYAVVGGNPAKVLKFRNKEQFLKLYNEKKFF